MTTRGLSLGLALCLLFGSLLPSPAPAQKTWPVNLDVPAEEAIAFALYTVHDGTLKMTVQLYPLKEGVDRTVKLQVQKNGNWSDIATAQVREDSYGAPQADLKQWMAHFRVKDWDASQDWKYQVTAAGGKSKYTGTIRKDVSDKEEIVVAAFTGNSKHDRRLKPDIIKNIKAQDPDLLFFSGDQSYDHRKHFEAWILFGKQFGEIIKDRPTICIPDDHDIGQANMWGENGVKENINEAGADGGYFHSPEYVNSVQRAQTWHLPDPYDPTPIKRGIGVYYTSLRIGKVDFAVIEDRKFKTGPKGLVIHNGPRPDHITDPDFNPQEIDYPDARLLGERQLKFLHEWGQDYQGVNIKTVLSQTVFANAAHRHGKYNYRLVADLDSNGWPQHGRNKALAEIRRCYGFMIGGDQHLATVIHHGINNFGDSGYSFCVPSIVNLYNRWWDPQEKAINPIDGPLEHLGSYYDGFHNRVTMHAYANPSEERKNKYGGEWGARAAGYGLVRFNTKTRKITMECWPRGVDVTADDAEQYPGWPITIDQFDNYGREGTAWLPTIEVTGSQDPVVQVIDETYGDVVYTVRAKGTSFRGKVFRDGHYTVKIGQPGSMKTLTGVAATMKNDKTLKVDLR